MTPEQHRLLVKEIGIGAAVLEYSKDVPLADPFWDHLTIQDLCQVYREVGGQQQATIITMMIDKASSFDDWKSVFAFLPEKHALHGVAIASVADHAQTIRDWAWVLEHSKQGSDLEKTALQFIQEAPGSYDAWRAVYFSGRLPKTLCLERALESSEDANQISYLILLSTEIGDGKTIRVAAEKKLETLITSFDAWQEFFKHNRRTELTSLALHNMGRKMVTFEECRYVYSNTEDRSVDWLDTCNAALGKILKMDLEFTDANDFSDHRSSADPVRLIMQAKMAEKASALWHWKVLYKEAQGALKDQALQQILKLAQPQTCPA